MSGRPMNAIFRPSGDQEGSRPVAGLGVRFRWSPIGVHDVDLGAPVAALTTRPWRRLERRSQQTPSLRRSGLREESVVTGLVNREDA